MDVVGLGVEKEAVDVLERGGGGDLLGMGGDGDMLGNWR